jgi:PAS domain S-box-containing protein
LVRSTNASVLQIAQRLAATIGADFFQAIVKNLASALAADCVIAGEFIGGRDERCRTIAAWMGGEPAEFDYLLAESATTAIFLGEPTLVHSDARSLFPRDALLKCVGAEACAGVPLKNGEGHPIGVLIALYRRPLTNLQVPKKLLEIFAERASAELVRKQEEHKLRESEQRYRAFIAGNVDALWRVEFHSPIPLDLPEDEQLRRIYQTGYVAECNDALAHLLGRKKAEELIGCGVDEIVPVSDSSIHNASLALIRAGYKAITVETNPLELNGKCRHFLRSQWGIVENGHLERIWGSTREVTRIKHAEMALEASKQRMADLLEAMRLFVILVDSEGVITYCNNCFYKATGWTAFDLVGANWISKLIPAGEQALIRTKLGESAADAPIQFESTMLLAGGQRTQVGWDAAILLGNLGENPTRALVGRDLKMAGQLCNYRTDTVELTSN